MLRPYTYASALFALSILAHCLTAQTWWHIIVWLTPKRATLAMDTYKSNPDLVFNVAQLLKEPVGSSTLR